MWDTRLEQRLCIPRGSLQWAQNQMEKKHRSKLWKESKACCFTNLLTFISKPWFALQCKAGVYLSVCLETSGQHTARWTDRKNDRLADRQTDCEQCIHVFSSFLPSAVNNVHSSCVCAPASHFCTLQTALVCVSMCVFVYVCVCEGEGENKPYWRCVPLTERGRIEIESVL